MMMTPPSTVLNLSNYNKDGSPGSPHFTWVLFIEMMRGLVQMRTKENHSLVRDKRKMILGFILFFFSPPKIDFQFFPYPFLMIIILTMLSQSPYASQK